MHSFLNKPCYLIPLTNDELSRTCTNNKVVLFVNNGTTKISIAIPILEKYGLSNMENAIQAEEKWYFYPSDEKEVEKVNDGRPIFKLNYHSINDIKIKPINTSDFITSIRDFSKSNISGDKRKVKQMTLPINY